MSASRVRTFVEMESHPIPMQHWEMNLNLDPQHTSMHTTMQMQVEAAAQSHVTSSSSNTTLSRTGKRQRTDAGISNIGVRIQQAMRQAQAMRQTMSMQHNTQHRTPTGMNMASSASPPHARIQSRVPVPVSPMNTPMNASHHVQPMSMCVEDMDVQGTTSTRTGATTRTQHWVCDSCGSSTMDHSMGCMHEESSLRCVSDD